MEIELVLPPEVWNKERSAECPACTGKATIYESGVGIEHSEEILVCSECGHRRP